MTFSNQLILAIDATRMRRERTGIENYLHHLLPELCQRWTAPADRDRSVVVFARDAGVIDHVQPRPQLITVRRRGWTQLSLSPALKRAGAGIYFTPIPILPLLGPLPCPAVVTVHDLHEFRRRWWYFRLLIGRTLQRASRVICVSEATRLEVMSEFPEAAAKCVVVPEGADPRVFFPRPDGADTAVLRRLGVERAPLLAVGTIQPRKNYGRLIRAYARARATSDLPPLVIVGRPGWGDSEVLQLPRQLGIDDRVILAGHLPEADVADLMRASVLLCAVSTAEGFGLPLVEAMYCGLPILASDIPPFREVAGNAAVFVDPLNELAIAARLTELLAQPARLRQLSETGLGRRSLFGWSRAAEAIVEVLEQSLTSL